MAVCSPALVSAADRPDAVDDYIRTEMAKQHIPGLALLVSRGGQVIRAQGYGLANVELQVPVKPETIFQSGLSLIHICSLNPRPSLKFRNRD